MPDDHPSFPGVEGPVLLVIMDGVGLYRGRTEGCPASALDLAATPVFDRLFAEFDRFERQVGGRAEETAFLVGPVEPGASCAVTR